MIIDPIRFKTPSGALAYGYEATIGALPDGSELIGFYSYGEIAPGANGTCDLHNQTMTITTFAEA